MRVVVIDRDREARITLSTQLIRYGCSIAAGAELEVAWQSAFSGDVALVLVAPDVASSPDAWSDMLYRLRRNVTTAMVPVIVHAPTCDQLAAVLTLADGHLPKPLDSARLKSLVQTYRRASGDRDEGFVAKTS